MIRLGKNFRIEILRNKDEREDARVRLAFLESEDLVTGLTPQQARALAIDLIKAAHLADASAGMAAIAYAGDEAESWA